MASRAVACVTFAALLCAFVGGSSAALSLACSTGPNSLCAKCTGQVCVKCKAGYFMPQRQPNSCKECPEWCTKCKDQSGQCTECAPGHTLLSGGTCSSGRVTSCIVGRNGCIECWEGKCRKCAPPVWVARQKQWDSWGLTASGKCRKCAPQPSVFSYACKACNGDFPTRCTACEDKVQGFPMFSQSASGGLCEVCTGGCLKCLNGSGRCVQCDTADGYYLNQDDGSCDQKL